VCLILRQLLPLLSSSSQAAVKKAVRKLCGFEENDLEDFRLNTLKQRCFRAVMETEQKEEEDLVCSYLGF
jgi:hypothetical protein